MKARVLLGALSCLWLLVGCEKDDAKAENSEGITSRSQAVEASGTQTQPSAIPVVAPAPSHAHKEPRELCAGQLAGEGKPFSKKPISKRAAAGSPDLEADLGVGGGRWTWVNFWAAWCVPCREEIPRLKGWERTLGGKLRVAFVSLDDDERQLEGFLSSQPTDGLKASYWLREGKEREDWLSSYTLPTDPELPMHLLVDARGRVRCTVHGAIEDSDLPAIRAIIER